MWIEILHFSNTTTNAFIAKLKDIFVQFVIPTELVSDNAPQFSFSDLQSNMDLHMWRRVRTCQMPTEKLSELCKRSKHSQTGWSLVGPDWSPPQDAILHKTNDGPSHPYDPSCSQDDPPRTWCVKRILTLNCHIAATMIDTTSISTTSTVVGQIGDKI